MSNARMTAAVDALVDALREQLPPGADFGAARQAMSMLLEELVHAATVQSASAAIGVLREVYRRLEALEAGDPPPPRPVPEADEP